LSDVEQHRLREYFAAEPEIAGDVTRLADLAQLLRRLVPPLRMRPVQPPDQPSR
jgi:hypothetical protein